MRSIVRALVLCHALLCSCSSSQPVGLASISSTLYVRNDTNATEIWAPRERLAGRLGESGSVQAVVAIDAWTSASIDIVSAATKPVHEVRKEVNAGASYEFANAALSGSYRYSTENDYWSHGGVASATVDMANNNTTLDLALFGSKDVVGTADDPWFRKPQNTLGGRLALTQVIDRKSLVQLSWESMHVAGFQSSPYRKVALGSWGTCSDLRDPHCVVESVPDERLRSAAVLNARRAFGEYSSVGLNYRFYIDDWGLYSHTLAPDLRVLVGAHGSFTLSYRYYTQSEASFYRPIYRVPAGSVPTYRTRDRELSALYSNRLGASYLHAFELGEDGRRTLRAALRAGVTRYKYLAFVGLDQVDAIEGTFFLSLDFN